MSSFWHTKPCAGWLGRILTLLPKKAAGRCQNPQARTPALRSASRLGCGFTGLPSPVLFTAAFIFGGSVEIRPAGYPQKFLVEPCQAFVVTMCAMFA